MKRLIILTDEESKFLVSMVDFKNYTSMDIDKVKKIFLLNDYSVSVCKFSDFDWSKDYQGVYILYQTSEIQGSFYKRYIEDLVYFLEKQGAIALPKYEFLKAHHDKIFMELIRSKFVDESLKTIKSMCYGSWIDAQNYNFSFPVVIKQISSSSGDGVFLARNRKEYIKCIKKAGNVLIAQSLKDLCIDSIKNTVKISIKYFVRSKSKYLSYETAPISTSMIVQNFIAGLNGDYKVLIFGRKFYTLYRKNRDNDFRASGSGKFYVVPEVEQKGLLEFSKRITCELDFPIFGIDIGFDGKEYHLLEFQMIHLGPYTLQSSLFWHEFHDGKWIKYEGVSDLEEVFSEAIIDYNNMKYQGK